MLKWQLRYKSKFAAYQATIVFYGNYKTFTRLLPAKKLAFVLLGSVQHYRQVRLITGHTRSLQWRHTPCFLMVLLWNKVALRCKWYHFWFHVSCLVHGLHGVWCSFQGWDGTLAHWVTHSVGVSLRTPFGGLCYPPTCSFDCAVSPSVVHVGWYTNG